jgi:RNA-directed DNA polymerase
LLKVGYSNSEVLNFVGYGCSFLVLCSDREVSEKVDTILKSFFQNLRLDLRLAKVRIVHTYEKELYPPGFDFLGFNIIHKDRWIYVRNRNTKMFPEREFITIINPSKAEIKTHLKELKKIVTSHGGLSQERIIDLLNPLIEQWSLSKRKYSTSKLFQKLDSCLYKYLWDWAKKRHPLMTEIKIKSSYFHKIGSRSSVFAKKVIVNNKEFYKKLSSHSSIKAKEHTYIKT